MISYRTTDIFSLSQRGTAIEEFGVYNSYDDGQGITYFYVTSTGNGGEMVRKFSYFRTWSELKSYLDTTKAVYIHYCYCGNYDQERGWYLIEEFAI